MVVCLCGMPVTGYNGQVNMSCLQTAIVMVKNDLSGLRTVSERASGFDVRSGDGRQNLKTVLLRR